jgi:hypothetical protein
MGRAEHEYRLCPHITRRATMTEPSDYLTFDIDLNWEKDDMENEIITLRNKEGNTNRARYDFSQPTENIKKVMQMANETTESSQWLCELGNEFQKLFFPVGKLTDNFCKISKNSPGNVRLRLFYPTDPIQIAALLLVPWEYLYLDPQSTGLKEGFLCLNERFSLVHCLLSCPLLDPEKLKKLDYARLPLKASFFLCLQDDEDQKNDVLRMYDNIAYDLKQSGRPQIIQLSGYHDRLEKEDVHLAIEEFDLAQYLIHGEIDGLVLAGAKTLKKTAIQQFVQASDKIKGVILAACSSATSYDGPAVAFHEAGVPMVVGMTQGIKTTVASSFLKAFYTKLAESMCSVEEAVAFARTNLYEEDSQDKFKLHWGLPRLFMRSTDSDLINRENLYRSFRDFKSELKTTIKNLASKPAKANVPTRWQEALEAWIECDKEMGVLYLYGWGGSGKSTEVARLLNKDHQLLGHFCRNDDHQTSNPLMFIRDSLYPQLEEYFDRHNIEYRKYLSDNVFPITAYDARYAFYNLFLLPLGKIYSDKSITPPPPRPAIIIDAIDDAVTRYPGESILDLLIDHQREITQYARVIITGNYSGEDGSPHQRIRMELERSKDINISWDTDSSAPIKSTELDNFGNIGEALKMKVLDHINSRCVQEQKIQVWSFLSRCDQVDLESVLNQANQLQETRETQTAKKTASKGILLEEYYEAYFNTVTQKDNYVEDVLCALVVAYKPLSHEFLLKLFDGKSDINIPNALTIMPAFIPEAEGVYTCHTSVRRFLDKKLFEDPCKWGNTHELFMKLGYSELKRRQSENPSKTRFECWCDLGIWSGKYIQNYLVQHAYKSYQYACYCSMRFSENYQAELYQRLPDDMKKHVVSTWGMFANSELPQKRSDRANEFLKLVIDPSFREFRMYTEGTEAAVHDMLFALRVILFEYTLATPILVNPTEDKERHARLVTAYEDLLDILTEDKQKELIALDRKVRGLNVAQALDTFKEHLKLVGKFDFRIRDMEADEAQMKRPVS